ncbi:MAG: tyrosine-type recombinase/integrase [Chloroflexi bacterium]|nr:tyrosine-type recombinase/integrase [Chloroflexota bacterium]
MTHGDYPLRSIRATRHPYSKHRREDRQILHPDLVDRLLQWPSDRKQREASNFLKYKDSQGRFADFHSLRHTFVTNLCKADIAPKTAQTLARHSDIRLTMNVYTHVDEKEQAAAVAGVVVRRGSGRRGRYAQSAAVCQQLIAVGASKKPACSSAAGAFLVSSWYGWCLSSAKFLS